MKTGDMVYTPRFCTVRIKNVFDSWEEAYAAGYKEPTHYPVKDDPEYGVMGKSLDLYHMEFAAYRR